VVIGLAQGGGGGGGGVGRTTTVFIFFHQKLIITIQYYAKIELGLNPEQQQFLFSFIKN
jgi:hypothetical protein